MQTLAVHLNGSRGQHLPRDYSQTPINAYWEVTRACALACRHCRAEASPNADPNQLTFDEGVALLRQIKDFGDPLPQLILTGGDPLNRPDLFELIDEARNLGIGVSITPATTPALTCGVLLRLKEHGVKGLGLSLDGSTAERHDSIRGASGAFEWANRAMRWAQELEMPLQVNTLVSAETAGDLPAIYELLKTYRVSRWSLFFLISVGRGKVLQPLTAMEAETLMGWIFETSRVAPFIVATTEAPSYRKIALGRMRSEGMSGREIEQSRSYRSFGIRDGHGIVFVSHTGEICPAGFLPLVAGNVREDHLVTVYRDAPTFRQLHDPTQFQGHCGTCPHHMLCGGSRSRAFAATGSVLAEDPLCTHRPTSFSSGTIPVPPL
jgi:radical SAM protein